MANKVKAAAKEVSDQVASKKWVGSKDLHLKTFGASVAIDVGIQALTGQKINAKTIAKSTASNAFYLLAPKAITGALFAKDIGVMVGQAAYGLHKTFNNKLEQKYQNGPRFNYQDTQQAATMRQAAVQAIQGSKLNARNSLGSEAALMHRAWSRNV